MAGYVGVDPRPFTLRKLFWMYDGKHDVEDGNTRSIMAAVYNTVSKKWIKPGDFITEKVKQARSQKVTEEDQVMSLGIALGVVKVGS